MGSSASTVLAGVRAGEARLVARTASATDACLHTISAEHVSFSFDPDFASSSDTAITVARDRFIADFRNEVTSVTAWGTRHGWAAADVAQLQVFVSDRYRISKSLVPAWYGHAGRLEFPARRVI